MSVSGTGNVSNLAATAAAMAGQVAGTVRTAVQGALGGRTFSVRSADSPAVSGRLPIGKLMMLLMLTQMDGGIGRPGREESAQRTWRLPNDLGQATSHPPAEVAGTAAEFFERAEFSAAEVAQVRQTLRGLDFRVQPLPHMADTMNDIVERMFMSLIAGDPSATSLGGENILLFSPSKPAADGLPGKADSTYLMHFNPGGVQDPHFHSGPRKLDIFAGGEWSLLIGGVDPNMLDRETVHFTELRFAAGYTCLTFTGPDVAHGFRGGEHGFAAISTHWTDREEMAKGDVGADTKNLMEDLTVFIPPEKVAVIRNQAVPYYVAQDLQRSGPAA